MRSAGMTSFASQYNLGLTISLQSSTYSAHILPLIPILAKTQDPGIVTDPSFVVQLPSLHPIAGSVLASCRGPGAAVYLKKETRQSMSSLFPHAASERTSVPNLRGDIHAFLQLPVSKTPTTQRHNRRKLQPKGAMAFVEFSNEELVSQGR